MSKQYDLIVIGTGPAASTVARKMNQADKRVAIVEAREFGGTCALRGCNPKKVYSNAASLVDQARRAEGKLARFDQPRIIWSDLLAFKREFTQPVVEKTEQSFSKQGIATFHGTARFVDSQAIEVAGERLEAERILIAVGARPRPLEFPGKEHVIHSDEFLELSELPRRVTFIGGGYISLEFAHVAARAGAEVTILDRGARILKGFDPDLVTQLTKWSRASGIEIRTGAEVTAVESSTGETTGETGFVVRYEQDGRQETIDADLIVHGAGRTPNLDGLNLAAAQVESNEDGIIVDELLRSPTNHSVFAAGDCAASGQPKLTPTANEEARIVAKNLFAESPEAKPNYGAIARVVFTAPCLAAVGMSEEAARKATDDLDVRHQDTSTWGSVRKTAIECAGYKVLIDKQTDRLLGAHLLGPGAEETINLFTLAITHGLTAKQMKATLLAFPTFGSDVRRMV